jgi:hypothetical protein
MTYTLIKISAPGWEKTFSTLQEVEKELSKYVCNMCEIEYGTSLNYMLSSACGCEFILEDDILDPPTTVEEVIQQEADVQHFKTKER